MTAKTFFENFSCVVNAPEGVKYLRQLIMASALSGKFSKPNEELSSNLEKLLQDARSTYLNSGSKREKPLVFGQPLIREFEIPAGWKWVRVGQICDLQTGATPSTRKPEYWGGRIPWLASGDINKQEIFECKGRITEEGLANSNCKVLPSNSVLMALNGQGKTRATVALLRIAAACNQSLVAMIPYDDGIILPDFLFLSLRYRYHEIRDITGQDQRRGLNMGLVSELSVPLAPLIEQTRIVAKVDELMRLCDRLEAEQQEREKLLPLLSRANHTRFVTEPSLASLQSVFQNPGTVFADDLRQTVLSLAVRGSLVPQVASDGTADDLISEISERKTQLLEANTIPTPSRLPNIDVQDVPYDLPKGWRWTRLESVCELITKGSSPKWQGVNYVTRPVDGVMFITSENVGNYHLRKMDEPKFVEAKFNEMEKRSILQRDDILINLVGASIGRSALWDRDDVANINQAVGIIRLVRGAKAINRRYLLHYLNSPTCLNIMFLNQVDTARANISLTNVKEFLVPIPPEAEQERIATKVDKVFNWIAELEEKQQAREVVSTRFAKAAVAAITSTEFTENDIMKPPKTEIVTALKVSLKPKKSELAPLAALLSDQKAETSAKTLWQLSGLEIDTFYRQLNTEMANGWIEESHRAFVRETFEIWQRINELKDRLGWEEVTGTTRTWWDSFEQENLHRPELLLRILERMVLKRLTITSFFEKHAFRIQDIQTVTELLPHVDEAAIESFFRDDAESKS